MFCSKCGKEITDGTTCPMCDIEVQINSDDEANIEINRISEIDQELSSLNAEEILLKETANDINKQKNEIEKALKNTNKKFKRSKLYRALLKCLTVLLTIIILIVTLTCGVMLSDWITHTADADYNAKVELLNQRLTQAFSNYEKHFISSLEQERKAQVASNIVSTSNKANLNEYIRSLYRHPSNTEDLFSHKDKEYYQVTDAILFDKYNLLDTSNNNIFPGSIIKGDSLFTNDYTVISAERTPITIISNQENGKAVQITNPNYSNVTTSINNYAMDYSGNLAKEWEYNLQSVSNSQELKATLGLSVIDLGVDLGFGTQEKESMTTIVYSQTYYSVSMEPMPNATDYFAKGVDLQILGENEPAYVSSVSYGRKIILIVSSDISQKDLSAKLNATIKGVSIGAGIENVLKDETMECQLISYGGKDISGILDTKEKDIGVIGNFKIWLWGDEQDSSGLGERLNTFLSEPGTLVNPAPLSYTLKYLSDNSIVPAMYINKESIRFAEGAPVLEYK